MGFNTHSSLEGSFGNRSVVTQVVFEQESLLMKFNSLGFFEVFAQC